MKNEKKFYMQPECEVLQLCVESAILQNSSVSGAGATDKETGLNDVPNDIW